MVDDGLVDRVEGRGDLDAVVVPDEPLGSDDNGASIGLEDRADLGDDSAGGAGHFGERALKDGVALPSGPRIPTVLRRTRARARCRGLASHRRRRQRRRFALPWAGQRAEWPRGAMLTVLLTERDCCTLASVKTNTVGIRLEPALLDRLDVVAARWSATSPIPIEFDRSTIVRGLMQRALLLVEAELGITPAVATAPAKQRAVTASAKPAKSAKRVKSPKRGR